MVNGVPGEVPRPKPMGPQAPKVFGRGTSRGTPFTMIHSRLFHTFSFFRHPGLVKSDFFSNGVPRDTTGKWRGHEALSIGRVKSRYAGPGCRKNVVCKVLGSLANYGLRLPWGAA